MTEKILSASSVHLMCDEQPEVVIRRSKETCFVTVYGRYAHVVISGRFEMLQQLVARLQVGLAAMEAGDGSEARLQLDR